MPQLLLELFSEEIPARMQGQAARDLERMARERMAAAGLPAGAVRSFAGPRRLTLVADGLPAAPADRAEERKGPRATAPEAAVQGFLRSTGLSRDQLSERDGVLYALLRHPGRPTPQIVAEMVEAIVRGFPWPKSMRSGTATLRWVRPLRRILCVFDGVIVPFGVEGIESGNLTEGHRFMADPSPFPVADFGDYAAGLLARCVVPDPAERRARIAEGCRAACAARGLAWVEDEGLLDEVIGLAEWPVPILGDMDPEFLDLPPEVIRTSMRTHQRYFAVRDPATGSLAPHFVTVANIAPADGGAVIARGNARVLTARLADARFFWDEDRRPGSFGRWTQKLQGVTFHAKLGTMAERVERIAALAREIAPRVGADPDLAETAARLCKADLASAMVGEFPELQGIMGGYYVRAAPALAPDRSSSPAADPVPLEHVADGTEDPLSTVELMVDPPSNSALSPPTEEGPGEGETPALSLDGRGRALEDLTRAELDQVADAVRDHYKPLGPSDAVPTAPVTVAVALADKFDTLVGFFAIDERPTGSKDPYALRRAALGIIRIISDRGKPFSLLDVLIKSGPPFLMSDVLDNIEGLSWNYTASESFETLEELICEVHSSKLIGAIFENDAPTKIASEVDNFRSWREYRRADAVVKIEADSQSIFGIQRFQARAEAWSREIARAILVFLADRLKVQLRDEGKRHDLVDAVFALGDDDLVCIVRRVDALSAFLATEDGASLLAGYKRAANILRAEAKKAPGEDHTLDWDLAALAAPEEQALSAALRTVQGQVDRSLQDEDFEGAMRFLSHLRKPVDAFFDKVLVNDPDPAVRLNRLRLLSGVRDTAERIADFSRVANP